MDDRWCVLTKVNNCKAQSVVLGVGEHESIVWELTKNTWDMCYKKYQVRQVFLAREY